MADPKPLRVLSLLSASTEIVYRLGCGHLLVGRSHGCDDPPLATTLPVATAPQIDPNAPSAQIDEAVRAQSVAGGPVYHIHADLVKRLRPDVVITQEQCRICAVTPEDVSAACALSPVTVKLVTIKQVTLDDVLSDVAAIAAALGVPERGERLVALLRQRLASLAALTAPLSSAAPRVAHVEWMAPLMGSGYWIAQCMEAAGCAMVHGSKGGHSQVLASASLLADADLILLAPCGFSLERTYAELALLPLLQSEAWLALPAVRRGAVAVADGNLFFNRSSCGVLETAEIVAEAAHPELCGLLGHHGKRWVWLSELKAFAMRAGAELASKPVALAPPSATPSATPPSEAPEAQAATLDADEDSGAVAHVHKQLQALRSGDFAAALALNSEANRARLGGAPAFEQIVRGSPAFRVLLENGAAPPHVVAEPGEPGARAASVRVTATPCAPAGGEVRFAFDLRRGDADRWETDGVRIEC